MEEKQIGNIMIYFGLFLMIFPLIILGMYFIIPLFELITKKIILIIAGILYYLFSMLFVFLGIWKFNKSVKGGGKNGLL